MNRRNTAAMICALSVTTACSQANAARADPGDDVHCSVLTYYYKLLADRTNAPQDQKHAIAAMFQWYSLKIQAKASTAGDAKTVLSQAEPVLEAVKRDPMSMRDELVACTERATRDPAFEEFARRPPTRL